jgi:hypothetical protein
VNGILSREIEARFIVSICPEEKEPEQLRQLTIDQRYLRAKGRIRRVRTKIAGQDKEKTSVVLNRKWKMANTLGGNWEMELCLPNTFFIARFCFWFLTKFLSDPACYPIHKTRTVYEWDGGMELEWDIFASQHALPDGPFGMLEVEVSAGFDLATLQAKLPKWFEVKDDVTGQAYWSNVNISRRLQRIYRGRRQ